MVLSNFKDFYLGTLMDRYEYIRIPIHMISNDIIALCKLHGLIHNGCVYVEIREV